MEDRSQVEALVRDAYACRCKGDLDGFMQKFGPEPHFRLAGDGILGELAAGVQGHVAVRAVMENLIREWDWTRYRIQIVLIDGNRAVVHGEGQMLYTPKQQTIRSETLDLLTIADGRITELIEFCDTHMAAEAMDLI